jgi:2-polyprenyl-3-methyl-5-hydroxy-6-metoxy-1,4-benzoquinol methylase
MTQQPIRPKDRATHEVEHGKWLLANDPETIWGWGTPAGKVRAQRRADMIAAGAGLAPGVRALEIGCGTGNFTELFAQTGAHILAVDLSEELLARARARNLPGGRIQFRATPFEECRFEGQFDALIGSSVLHHLDMDVALPKMFSLLKPGGWFCFSEPNMLNPQVFLERHFRSWFPYTSPDETAFVRWSFQRKLEQTGFVDIELTPVDWLHPNTPTSLIPMVRLLGTYMERLPVLREFSGSLHIRARKPRLGHLAASAA